MKKAQNLVGITVLLVIVVSIALSLSAIFNNQKSNLVKYSKVTKNPNAIPVTTAISTETTGVVGAPRRNDDTLPDEE